MNNKLIKSVEELVLDLSKRGYTTRQISRLLKMDGIQRSHEWVAKKIKELSTASDK